MFNIIPNLNDNFFKWFGDSKIVDTNNQPIIMYHRSRCKELFSEFRLENVEKNPYNVDYGIFFVNAHYSNSISYIADGLEYYVFLKMVNPFYIFDFNNHIKLAVYFEDKHKLRIEKTDDDILFIE